MRYPSLAPPSPSLSLFVPLALLALALAFSLACLSLPFPSLAWLAPILPILPILFLLAGPFVPIQTTTSPPSTLPDPLPETQSKSQSQSPVPVFRVPQSLLALNSLTHSHFSKFLIIFPFSPIFSSLNLISSNLTLLSLSKSPLFQIQRYSCGRPFVGAGQNCYSRHARSTIQPSLPPSGNFGPESTLPSK